MTVVVFRAALVPVNLGQLRIINFTAKGMLHRLQIRFKAVCGKSFSCNFREAMLNFSAVMKWKARKTVFRGQLVARPIDDEEEREEWKQSLSVIPDFDLSSVDSEEKMEALRHSSDLVLKQQ